MNRCRSFLALFILGAFPLFSQGQNKRAFYSLDAAYSSAPHLFTYFLCKGFTNTNHTYQYGISITHRDDRLLLQPPSGLGIYASYAYMQELHNNLFITFGMVGHLGYYKSYSDPNFSRNGRPRANFNRVQSTVAFGFGFKQFVHQKFIIGLNLRAGPWLDIHWLRFTNIFNGYASNYTLVPQISIGYIPSKTVVI